MEEKEKSIPGSSWDFREKRKGRQRGFGNRKMGFKIIFLAFFGGSYGLLSSAGVFTVLVAIGLVPRFAGQTHTANKVLLYEEAVVFGTIIGCIFSIFEKELSLGHMARERFPQLLFLWEKLGIFFQGFFGFFCGMFIGCLALAIAEMLDSIPIFARRIGFRHGIGLAVLSMAAGKLLGAFFHFGKLRM